MDGRDPNQIWAVDGHANNGFNFWGGPRPGKDKLVDFLIFDRWVFDM